MDRRLLEYNPELHALETDELAEELGWAAETGARGVFSETQEMQLAATLLEVTDEAELDHFLGNLIAEAAQSIGRFISPPSRQALGRIMKDAAKQALPMVERAIHSQVGLAPQAQARGQVTSVASRIFGLELEGLGPEDKEFEVAKRFVQFVGEAAKNAINTPITAKPRAVAIKAAKQAAQRYAPGLLRGGMWMPKHTGHWFRRGHTIIVEF